ncbi:MAG: superoxide dismutase [Rhodospirillaceae bacterium]|nr:superoxide dismutase [Rhodospirillaceae bacterium]
MTTDMNRRGAVGTIVATTLAGFVPAANAQTPPAPAGVDIKPLSIDPKAIAGFSENIIRSHYDNNYSGAVKRLSSINAQLATLDMATAPNFTLNGLKREQLVAMNSAILHELYFAGLGAGGEPKADLATALERDFGSVEKWRTEFSSMGKALGGGSGWVLLSYVPRVGRLINVWAADHTMTAAGATPILALDMYEHAYHMDFGAKAAAYVEAFMKIINWGNVASAYTAAHK